MFACVLSFMLFLDCVTVGASINCLWHGSPFPFPHTSFSPVSNIIGITRVIPITMYMYMYVSD